MPTLAVRQRLDLNHSVVGLSNVGRRYQRNIINSRDGSAADGEVNVHSTEHECRIHVQNE